MRALCDQTWVLSSATSAIHTASHAGSNSSKADELKGNLKLETLEQVLKGGASGPAIIPGDVENSFLLRAIRYQEDDYQMPPRGRLPDEEVAKIEKWVAALKGESSRLKVQSSKLSAHEKGR